jgi:hypothetical protein
VPIALSVPDVVDRYAKVFGVQPEFGAPTTQVMVSARTLALPMPQAHQPTARLAQRLCEDLIRRRQTADGLVASQGIVETLPWVGDDLRAQFGGDAERRWHRQAVSAHRVDPEALIPQNLTGKFSTAV